MSSIDLLRPSTEPEVDWTNLPPGCSCLSLWPTLHDGDLLSCSSDLLARTVSLTVRVDHLADGPGDDAVFVLGLGGVSSARVTTWRPWPGPLPETKGLPRSEEFRLIAEYRSKFRWESLGWGELESAAGAERFWIMDADLANSEGRYALRIEGYFDGTSDIGACSIVVRGEALSIARGDGRIMTLEEFSAMGATYWEHWGSSDRREHRVP